MADKKQAAIGGHPPLQGTILDVRNGMKHFIIAANLGIEPLQALKSCYAQGLVSKEDLDSCLPPCTSGCSGCIEKSPEGYSTSTCFFWKRIF